MTRAQNQCPSHLFAGLELDNRALSQMATTANFSDVLAVAKGFCADETQGFNHFRTDNERCMFARESARALVRGLLNEDLLAAGEVGI
jgi:hypothetical protein